MEKKQTRKRLPNVQLSEATHARMKRHSATTPTRQPLYAIAEQAINAYLDQQETA